ncbi:phosphoribosylanthranilate isomerase [Planctomycetaceae bacterium SH139]
MHARLPFTVKICGVRTAEDLAAVQAAGGDAVGLNFHPPSPRYLPPEEAAMLAAAAIAGGVLPIGLFVNQTRRQLIATAEQVGIRWLQLHGDETPQFAAELLAAEFCVLRAVRLPPGPLGSADLDPLLGPWLDLGCHVLLDAEVGAHFGGQGQKLDWRSLGAWVASSRLPGGAIALAGGLTPENVAEAIGLSRLRTVDVASGVEISRGEKSSERIHLFCQAARGAVSALPPGRR